MLFNLNENVRIKLTSKGKDILRKKHAAFIREHGNLLSDKTKVFTLPEEDEHGFSEWQMWKLFADFGEHIFMGCEPPFDLNIEIPVKEGAG